MGCVNKNPFVRREKMITDVGHSRYGKLHPATFLKDKKACANHSLALSLRFGRVLPPKDIFFIKFGFFPGHEVEPALNNGSYQLTL